jgi:hypothetical protein
MIGNGQEINGNQHNRRVDGENHIPPAEQQRQSEILQDPNMGEGQPQAQCHIYTYESKRKIYALGYSWRPDQPFRFGLGSFLEEKTNKVISLVQFSRSK